MVVVGGWLDLMFLEVSSNLGFYDSMTNLPALGVDSVLGWFDTFSPAVCKLRKEHSIEAKVVV